MTIVYRFFFGRAFGVTFVPLPGVYVAPDTPVRGFGFGFPNAGPTTPELSFRVSDTIAGPRRFGIFEGVNGAGRGFGTGRFFAAAISLPPW